MRKYFVNGLLCLFLGACRPATPVKTSTGTGFDLKGYISREAGRLQSAGPLITKTVVVNGSAEQRKLKITDWQKELAVFADADINKPAWKGLFALHKDSTLETYVSANEKVPVKSLRIFYRAGKVRGLEVLIRNANTLYTSGDTLRYFPDSLYQISKTQHIRLMNEKKYLITGKF